MDLSGLNPPQREAVLHARGPLVVFAGAGSGKTRVITHRVAQLVQEGGVPPWRILAVTFTNKAAGEMRARLEQLVPGAAADLWVGTFHAICAKLLRRYAEGCGVRSDFVIYDDSDQRALLTRVLRDMGLDERRYAPRLCAWVINREKQECRLPDQMQPEDDFERVVQQVYEQYQSRLGDCGALDFGDLIFRLVVAMRGDEALRREIAGRWSHVLVDEFQDTNRVQWLLVHLLCQDHQNLCVVGDDDQSIYRWRGAERRNILDFTTHYPGARLIKLEQNYRSTQRILRVANAVVARNLEREPKRLWCDNEEGAPVTLMICDDERDEAATIVRAMLFLLDAGHARSDIAVLYRTHAQSRALEEALRRQDLPYRVVGGLRFYDRAEVKDLLAYLRLAHNPDDDVSMLRIINTPPRGIGKTTVTRLMDAAARAGSSVYQALGQADADPAQSSAAKKRLAQLREQIDAWRDQAKAGAPPADLAQTVLSETGYLETLQADRSVEAESKLENLNEVLGTMRAYEEEEPEPTLSAFLELVSLQTDVDRMDDGEAITLMTVHAAKGLEFPVVMVAGLEEETFPHRGFSDEDDPEELEEERRLAYVAFTRAEERLFLSYAQSRRVFGDLRFRRPSRFLDEMPQDELQVVGARAPRPRMAVRPMRAPAQRPLGAPEPAVPGDSHVDLSEGSDLHQQELRRGMRVRHGSFGVGRIESVAAGVPPRVTVQFESGDRRQIVASYLEPL